MGPEVMVVAAVASAASAAIGGYASYQQANASAAKMEAQAKADQAAAATEAQWSERRQNEELAAGQAAARERIREMKMAQSKLIAQAGATNAGDQSVMDLWKGIETQGEVNAGREFTNAQQKADSLKYQSDLSLWRADSNPKLPSYGADRARAGGTLALIGGGLGAIGSGMSSYYNIKNPRQSGGTGYGGSSYG